MVFDVLFRRGLPYAEGIAMQEDAVRRLRADSDGTGLLLCAEHTPVITMGRAGHPEHLLCDAPELARRGIGYAAASRGGDITWHGPGQVTLYPVFPLEWFGRDLHEHMRRLEQVGVTYLAGHGMAAGREVAPKPRTGVWVGEEKIAAIGIAVRGWVVYHGIGMNVQPDMEGFGLIRPCGIVDRGVTSLARLTGQRYDMETEMRRMAEAFFAAFAGARPADGGEC